MTTKLDRGAATIGMMVCGLHPATSRYSTLELALRDMRSANGRDAETGAGDGNASLIGLALGLVVLDTLTDGEDAGFAATRWATLLISSQLCREDADIIYAVRCSLLHGYGPPKQDVKTHHRKVAFSAERDAYALDTDIDGRAVLSVPVFCGRLVERIAMQHANDWDTSLVDTDFRWRQ